jgi:hypothetical protein
MEIKKTAILPIISVIALGVGAVTGHQIDAKLQDEIATYAATIIGVGVSIWGVIKNHKKEAKPVAKVTVPAPVKAVTTTVVSEPTAQTQAVPTQPTTAPTTTTEQTK